MASGYVWGIDIGQCGLKALRGKLAADGKSVEADSFDYVEYPQILSQPDANPPELIREALKTFLARNDLRGDQVAISLPGQSGLSKFIKLPPVDAKQLPQVVGYEAKTQIPFDLEEVIWDYQRMPGEYGASEEDGDDIPMPTEVGLFAIKRDQLFRSIRPLIDADVEIDVIQLTPMALYNALSFDQLKGDEEYDDEKGGEWVAGLSIGTEAADLVITNGYRVWQRSIPIGGNHFTKQLLQDLKLTFAKAELVKRGARESADAKQLFKTMRPVFNDLVTETQRSIGYFGSLERAANVDRLVLMGNASKLPGLPQFLGKNLDMPVDKLRSYERLTGSAIEDGQFTDNLLAFPVCYGLVLQGLGKGQLNSNLVPPEIIRSRIIRRKKPWAAAIAAATILACAFNFFFQYRGWNQVHPEMEVNNVSWEQAEGLVTNFQSDTGRLVAQDTTLNDTLLRLNELGQATVGSDDGRRLWLELLKTITDCLPIDPDARNAEGELVSMKDRPLSQRKEIYIDVIESQYFPELTVWNSETVQGMYKQFLEERQAGINAERRAAKPKSADGEDDGEEEVVEEDAPPDAAGASEDGESWDAKPGWVIQISGYHFQRKGQPGKPWMKDKQYIRKTLMEQLENGTIQLPMANGKLVEFTAKEMGIYSPILVKGEVNMSVKIPNPDYRPPAKPTVDPANPFSPGAGNPFAPAATAEKPAEEDKDNPPFFNAERYDFVVQFAWRQVPMTERIYARKALADAKRRDEQ